MPLNRIVAFNQIILAAPDVDADNFKYLTQSIEGVAKGITLYAASNDRALIVSRNFWRNPRAGDVVGNKPLVMQGVDTIDVSATSLDIVGFITRSMHKARSCSTISASLSKQDSAPHEPNARPSMHNHRGGQRILALSIGHPACPSETAQKERHQ